MIFFRFYFLILLIFPYFSWGAASQSLSHLGPMTELTLKNGMKVCLFQTKFETDTIVFQLFAMGGYASLSPIDQPSGALAAEIAWESGLNNKTADQISFDLYQKSIELETKIQPFDRLVEAYCYTEDLPECLNLIHGLFTQPKFEQEALKRVIAKNHQAIRCKSPQELGMREALLKLHTENWTIFDPLTLQDLDYVNLTKAEKFFKHCFGNPSEFVFVLVGDFELEAVEPIVYKYLESIPVNPIMGPTNPSSPLFPNGITRKKIEGYRSKAPFVRLTFPVSEKTDQDTTKSLNLICHMIKSRLNKQLSPASCKNLEVSYEFPFFPKLDETWLTIQFLPIGCSNSNELIEQTVEALKKLKDQGPTQEELNDLIQILQSEEMDVEENTYILSLISNYYRANWDINSLKDKKPALKVENEMIKNEIKRYLQLSQYSIIFLNC